MTDAAFLLEVLSDGEPHSHAEILSRSFAERGCGLTIHSRAAQLRGRGNIVKCELGRANGRVSSTYQLLQRAAGGEASTRTDQERRPVIGSSTSVEAPLAADSSGRGPECVSPVEVDLLPPGGVGNLALGSASTESSRPVQLSLEGLAA